MNDLIEFPHQLIQIEVSKNGIIAIVWPFFFIAIKWNVLKMLKKSYKKKGEECYLETKYKGNCMKYKDEENWNFSKFKKKN